MNALNGLDGKSLMIGGALVVGALAATHGGLLPVLLVGGLVYMVGSKKGWWEGGPHRAGADPTRHRSPGGPPFFAEWHRQAHAADAPYRTAAGWPAGSQPAAPAPTQPRDAEVRIPVTPAPAAPVEPPAVPEPAAPEAADRRTVGENGAPLA